MGVQGGYAKSVESFGYATEMNPKLKGKKTPLLPPEPTEEYIPPAFNASEVHTRPHIHILCRCLGSHLHVSCSHVPSPD